MLIRVAAGIIERDGQIFVALRSSDKHQGGLWEFPGGKVEADETPQAALSRELAEECGIEVQGSESFHVIRHDYSDKSVELHFYRVFDFACEPHGKEGQQVAWVSRQQLTELAFPEANVPIVDMLQSK
ncbi:8-oxo-dGTP diphosphatase MutT [Marinomonas ostreistagni]|uniref:8-oxo-dGTP diphosphatase MutT n=1 Tax=Marinomonas ostreistagni TaxID=359209 RepID=UPI0019505B2D|nr:8-oxo-dGTP diphosphatase MutT [Marinomonas ostreistagni]MBM6549759.1 8-oxo-dGTP diphosphatase MutT [Marinomonas ostreistagni]